jgi:UDP-N-acetylglucosamine transferase subunit ALG13
VQNFGLASRFLHVKLIFSSLDDSFVLIKAVKADQTHVQSFDGNQYCPSKVKYLSEIGT